MAILPVALCQPLSEPHSIDGRLEEDIWSLPPAIPFFVRPRVRWIPEAQTQVYAAYDDSCLILAFRCYEDAPERVERGAGPPSIDYLFHDDFVGFSLQPNGIRLNEFGRTIAITASGKASEHVESSAEDERGSLPHRFVERPEIECAVTFGEREWTVEASLPLQALNLPSPQPGSQWGFTASRTRVGARAERSGWLEIRSNIRGDDLPGWLQFEPPGKSERAGRAIEPYLRRFGAVLDARIRQTREAEEKLGAGQCLASRYRANLMIHSLMSIKNDIMHSYHPDALRHYAQALQFNVGRLDELIEILRQGEDPYNSHDGYVFMGARFAADRQNHAFAALLGRSYDSTTPHPAIIFLHGLSSDWIAESRSFMSLAWPPELDFVMAIPSGLGLGRRYWLAAEDEIFSVLNEIKRRFSIDETRVALVGMGQSADAAYRLARFYPDTFSCVATAGPIRREREQMLLPHFLWMGEESGWVYRDLGASEPIPLDRAQTGNPEALTPEFIGRLTSVRRMAPRCIKLRAESHRGAKAYWARIDRFADYSKMAELEAAALDDGRIVVRAENVAAYSLLLDETPFLPGQKIRIESNETLMAETVERKSIAFELSPAPQGAMRKSQGLSGPITEAFHGAQLYVYGTANPAIADMLRHAALQACRWPGFDLRIPVKADREVGEDDIAEANLHLFGGPAANRLLAQMRFSFSYGMDEGCFRIADKRYGDPDHVCQFVFPNPLNPKRYVAVYLANSESGWMYRGWYPRPNQPRPFPDLWIAKTDENPQILKNDVSPVYQEKRWFDETWQLV